MVRNIDGQKYRWIEVQMVRNIDGQKYRWLDIIIYIYIWIEI